MNSLALVLFGLTAATSWGVADFLIAKSSKTAGAMKGALLVNAYGAVIYAIAFALFLGNQAHFTAEGIWFAVGGSAFLGLAQALFFKAMRYGPVGLVSSIASVYPIISLLTGVLLFAANLSSQQVIGILLVVGGVMAASGATDRKETSKRLGPGPLLALVPVLGWGIGWALMAQGIARMGWESVALIGMVLTPVMLAPLVPLIKGDERFTAKAWRASWLLPAILGAAVIQMTGFLALNLGIAEEPDSAAVAIAISACYPVLTIFLALRQLNERIPLVPLSGGIVGIIGVVVLSLG